MLWHEFDVGHALKRKCGKLSYFPSGRPTSRRYLSEQPPPGGSCRGLLYKIGQQRRRCMNIRCGYLLIATQEKNDGFDSGIHAYAYADFVQG